MISTRSDAEKFAAEWAAAWNRRDAEAVLAHFHDDIIFTSPTALAVIGSPVVHGKDALRAYWSTALERISSIRFTVTRVLWDSMRRELAIIYIADIDGRTRTVSENLVFGDDGRVAAAEVFHGVPTPHEP
jgi:ketosteroid isomerase-like protein